MIIFKPNFKQTIVLLMLVLLTVSSIEATAQSSPNYKMAFDVFSQAGKPSASQNYRLRDCLGQPSATGESNNGLWQLDAGFMGMQLQVAAMALNFTAGWSWISFYVQPENPALEQVFAGMQHLKIAVNGAGRFYIPNVINSIGNLDVRQGYKVYFDAPEQLAYTGTWVQAFDTPIQLSAGWNFISYLAAADLDAPVALQSILPALSIVKDDAGNFFIPGIINSLGKMKLKKGYKVYMKNSATLVYPLIPGGQNSTQNLAKVHNPKPSRF